MSDEAALGLVLTARNLAGREVDKLGGSLEKVDRKASGARSRLGGVADVLGGLGKVAGLAAIGGIGLVVTGLIGATKAAADEEKGIKRMDAALRANIKGWDGNSSAIEDVISQRENLAFSDDDLRASLSSLVVGTHDVSKALELQSTAMDLARLKGISLEDATKLVMKASQGNAGAVKKMGIEVAKGAKGTEILAAIQKAAAGQAKAYGATAVGAMEAFQISVGDVVEDVGSAFVPIMAQAFTFLRTDALPAVRGVIGQIQGWAAANRPLIESITTFIGKVVGFVALMVQKLVPVVVDFVSRVWNNGLNKAFETGRKLIGSVIDVLSDLVSWIASNKDAMAALSLIATGIGRAFGFMADVVNKALDVIPSAFRWVANAAIGLVNGLIDVVNKFIDAYNAIPVLGDIPKFGHLPKLHAPSTGNTGGTTTRGTGVSGVGARGRPVALGRLYRVNEDGTEFFQPNQAGRVIAADRMPRSSGGTGGGRVIITIDGRQIAEIVDEHLYGKLRRSAPTIERV